jgi:hypothetical protein
VPHLRSVDEGVEEDGLGGAQPRARVQLDAPRQAEEPLEAPVLGVGVALLVVEVEARVLPQRRVRVRAPGRVVARDADGDRNRGADGPLAVGVVIVAAATAATTAAAAATSGATAAVAAATAAVIAKQPAP